MDLWYYLFILLNYSIFFYLWKSDLFVDVWNYFRYDHRIGQESYLFKLWWKRGAKVLCHYEILKFFILKTLGSWSSHTHTQRYTYVFLCRQVIHVYWTFYYYYFDFGLILMLNDYTCQRCQMGACMIIVSIGFTYCFWVFSFKCNVLTFFFIPKKWKTKEYMNKFYR